MLSKGYMFKMRSGYELEFREQQAVQLYKKWLKGETNERGASFTDPFTKEPIWITFEGIDYIRPIERDFGNRF